MNQLSEVARISTRVDTIRPAFRIGPTELEGSTATLHVLPLHARRDPGIIEWSRMRQRLGQIARLPDSWNGGMGVGPALQTISFADRTLAEVQQMGVPAPTINPSPDGALYAEWHMKGIDIELIFEAPYRITILIEDARKHLAPIEGEGSDLKMAIPAFQALCDR